MKPGKIIPMAIFFCLTVYMIARPFTPCWLDILLILLAGLLYFGSKIKWSNDTQTKHAQRNRSRDIDQ